MKLITIITTAFNAERTLERTILSVREQTYPYFEYIIIDHGSTDKTREIIIQNCSLDSRLHLIAMEKNTGCIGKALNIGLRKAVGEYICFLDSDDIYKKDFLKIMLNNMLRAGSDVGICGFSFYSERKGKLIKTFTQKKRQLISLLDYQTYFGEEIERELCFSNIDYYWNKFYRAEFIKDNFCFPETKILLLDAFFNLDIINTKPNIIIVPEAEVICTLSDKSTSSNWKIGMKDEVLEYAERWKAYLEKFLPEEIILHSMFRFMSCLNDFYKLSDAKISEKEIIRELISWLNDDKEIYDRLLRMERYDRKYLNSIEMALINIKNNYGKIQCEDSIFLEYYNKYMFMKHPEEYLQEILQVIWNEKNIFSLGIQELVDMIL